MGRNRTPARAAWQALSTAPLFALALLAAALFPSEALANKVGVAAAVKPDAFSGGTEIRIGKSIFYNERINTSGEGLVQVLLLDGSTFTVGPGSDLVIDKFVYDPAKQQGEIAASFSKGVVRFVGGKISKDADSVTVKTPAGALAIRGGMFQGAINNGGNIFSFLYGEELVLTGTNGQVYRVFQPGYTLDLTGGTPTIRPTTAADTALIMSALQGGGRAVAGGTGGADGTGENGTGGNNQNQQSRNNSSDPFQDMQTIVTDATTTIINQQIQDQQNNNTQNPNPDPNPDPNPGGSDGVPTQTAEYRGFAGGLVYSDEPVESFVNPVTSASFSDFKITEFSDGTATARMILRDLLEGDPAVSRYDFSFASQNGYNFVPTKFTAYNDNGEPYAQNFAATSNISQGGQGFCDACTFMKWGAVTAIAQFGPSSNPKKYKDEITPAYWVASNKITSPVEIDTLAAQNATATYMGDMVGSVYDASAETTRYSTTGVFTLDWYFADREGYMDMTFDERNYFGTMENPGGTSTFTGGLTNQQENQVGIASGGFFDSQGVPAGGVMGNFAIKEPGYKAGGIFAGTGKPGISEGPYQ